MTKFRSASVVLAARTVKIFHLLARPEYRHALRRRIAATVEHEQIPFAHDFASVIDVGAHQGQFALFASVRFPDAHLYCFEPQSDARARLVGVIPPHRLTVFPYAVGEHDHAATFYITERRDSSSLRVPTVAAAEAFSGVETATTSRVEVRALDGQLMGQPPAQPILLKIDVQGAEHEALVGASHLLDRVHTILVEASFQELYTGQRLAGDVVRLLEDRGFRWRGIYSLRRDTANRCLQGDLLFERIPAD